MTKTNCKSHHSDKCLWAYVENMVVLLSETFAIQYASRAFLKAFSSNDDDLLGRSFFDFVSSEEKYIVGEALEHSLFMPGEKIIVQYVFCHAGSNLCNHYEMIVKNNLQDKSAAFIMLDIRDITDRVVLQNKLLEQEQRWRVIFDEAKDGMLIVDRHGSFLAVNPVVCEKLGYEEDELFLRNALTVVAPDFRERASQRLQGTLHDDSEIFESLYVRKDGSFLPVELSCSTITFKGSECLLAVVRDVSARKKLEAEKEQLQKQFLQAQKMETVGRLAAGIAHDFNNLLTVLMNNLELLAMDLPSIDPLRSSVDDCQKAVDAAADLTRQLLTFSRPAISEEIEVININASVKAMHSMLKRLLPETVRLHLNLNKNDLFIKLNKANFEQIIVNLVVNARDAIAEVGEITISIKAKGNQVILSVSDNGCGIPLDLQEKIFEPFFSTKGNSGTGLGLFTVYGLVYKADGKLNLISAPGQGTTFEIIFPSVKAVAEKTSDSYFSEGLSVNTTILVVEDELPINKSAVRILQRYHYRVYSVASAEEALTFVNQMANNQKIDLLFTDVTLPGMTGIQLAKQMRGLGLIRRCLLTSGYVYNPDSLPDIEKSDGDSWQIDFISKPYRTPGLLTKVRKLLE